MLRQLAPEPVEGAKMQHPDEKQIAEMRTNLAQEARKLASWHRSCGREDTADVLIKLNAELAHVTAERDRLRGYANSADDVADNLRAQLSEALEALENSNGILERVARLDINQEGQVTEQLQENATVVARLRKEPNSEGS
jgi:ABC-type transporter Mla subunit MlaD